MFINFFYVDLLIVYLMEEVEYCWNIYNVNEIKWKFWYKNYIKYLKLGMNYLVIIINLDLFDIDLFFDKVEMFYEIV